MFATRTPTLPPATHTNSFAVGGREILLIEPATPYADEQRAFLEWARTLCLQGRKLVAIVATHHHPDHVGGLDAIARELGAGVWVHEKTEDLLDATARLHVTRRLRDGDEIILDGARPEAWRVLFTPGHAPGHVCLYEPEARTLIVGDMAASTGTIVVAPDEGDMQEYIASLERLASLDATIALPAHGEPIREPAMLFRKYVAHRKMREKKIYDAVAASGSNGGTLAEIVTVAYADTPEDLWPFAKLSLEAHLVKLVREGRVARLARPVSDRFRLV